MPAYPDNSAALPHPRHIRRLSPWIITGACCLIGAGDHLGPAEHRQRSHEIVGMTEVERTRLRSNFEIFRRMPEPQKDLLRGLHDHLEEDTKTGGQLRNIVDAYGAWLETLLPGQRDDLARESDVKRKIALVRQYKEEQDSQHDDSPGRDWLRIVGGDLPGKKPGLSASELVIVMNQVAAELPERDRQHLGTLDDVQRHREILELAFVRMRDEDFPGPDAIDRIIQAIPNKALQDSVSVRPRPEAKRRLLVQLIVRSVIQQLAQKLRDRMPNEAELRQFFSELDGPTRGRLMELPKRFADIELMKLYAQQKSPELESILDSQRSLRPLLDGRRDRFGPGGGPPPGGGPGRGPGRNGRPDELPNSRL